MRPRGQSEGHCGNLCARPYLHVGARGPRHNARATTGKWPPGRPATLLVATGARRNATPPAVELLADRQDCALDGGLRRLRRASAHLSAARWISVRAADPPRLGQASCCRSAPRYRVARARCCCCPLVASPVRRRAVGCVAVAQRVRGDHMCADDCLASPADTNYRPYLARVGDWDALGASGTVR